MGQFLEMRYSRSFRLFCAFLRTSVELMTNAIIPAVSARFFIYLFGIPHYTDIFGWNVPTFALLIFGIIVMAMTLMLMGGTLAIMVTDTIQGLMTYPIIFVFTMYIILHFSWWDELVPVMTDRVSGESFLNPYDIQSLRDFNLFSVFVLVFSSIINRATWFGGGATSAARTAHEQKMAGILGAWRNGFNPLFFILLSVMILTVMNHINYAPQAKTIRTEMCVRVAEDIIKDKQTRNELIQNITSIPQHTHTIGVDKPLSEKENLDTPYMNTVQKSLRETPEGNAKFQEFRTLYNQVRLPVVIRNILPEALMSLFVLLMIMMMLSTDDSYMFSSAMTIIQDIVMPLRKTPLSPERHIRLLRWAIVFVCIFLFFASLFMTQLDYIKLYTIVVSSIWVGGAGSVMLGGLYSRFGTTAGAYASLLTGAAISGGGLLVQRNWADLVYPFLEKIGWAGGVGWFLETVSKPFNPWIVWEMNPIKFPVNSNEIFFLAMVLSIGMYCLVSYLTCRRPFNLERMLHRGKYSVDGEVKTFEKLTLKTVFKKLIGITPDCTRGDKIIIWGTFIWSFGVSFGIYFLGTIIWNTFSPWPTEGWAWRLLIISFGFGGVIALFSMIWFLIGGIIDIRRMFRDLAARISINELDNGMVEGNVSLADKKQLEKLDPKTDSGKE